MSVISNAPNPFPNSKNPLLNSNYTLIFGSIVNNRQTIFEDFVKNRLINFEET